MKRYLTSVLAACLVCTLLGCAAQRDETTSGTNTSTAASTAETVQQNTTEALSTGPVTLDGTLTAVSVPAVTEVFAADDGTQIFSFTYQNMSLTLSGQAAADNVIVDFLGRVDTYRSTAETILSSARANYSASDSWIPYSCQAIYNPTRIDRGVLSLFGNVVTYSGASHPERTCIAANYDLLSGEPLTLGSILSHVDSVEPLCQLVIDKLDAIAEEKYLRSGYEADVRQRFAGEESYDEDWYFSNTGLCFYFSPYEIAPYSSGVIIAEIPYAELVGIIADEFFPAEQHNLTGTARVIPFDPQSASQFTQISELIFDQEGDMLLVYADSSIQDFRVLVTDPTTGESYTAFAAQYLNPTDAVVIQAAEEAFANIQLQYYSSGEIVTMPLITQ